MTDIHTHILPGVDDGAATVQDSLAMLRMEYEQGVRSVVLTPHFYPKRESIDRFLARRDAAFEQLSAAIAELPEEERAKLPELHLGAEVAWQSDLLELDELRPLCMGRSRNMLVELPFTLWNGGLIRQLNELMTCFGITPVIAHLERYLDDQDKKLVERLLALDIPVQISCAMFDSFFTRRKAMKLLRSERAHIVASDCHDCGNRPPNMAQAAAFLQRKLGRRESDRLLSCAHSIPLK